MTTDIDSMMTHILEFEEAMRRLGIPCTVQFLIKGVPVQDIGAMIAAVGPAAGPVQDLQNPDLITSKKPAVAKEKKLNANRAVPGKIMKCLYCDLLKDTRTLHRHSVTAHKDLYDKAALTEYIRGNPISAAGPGPADPPVPAADTEIKKGMRVRQVKPDKGQTFLGTALVNSRMGGLINVDLGNGYFRKVDAACLEAAES